MTAVDLDALAKLRGELASAVREWLPRGTYNPAHETDADDIAHALLPVVDRIATERAAAELEAAAGDYLANTAFLDPMREMRRGDVATDLMWRASTTRDRAAALRASNGEGATT